jgi:uncharacterized membrane protein
MSIMRFPSGLLVGATLMYFLDPIRGRKRRARLREAAEHGLRVERELVGKAVRDAQHRAKGLTERVRHPLPTEVSDGVLHGRARAALGRVVSHPGAIEIEVHDGRAIVRGEIFTSEADELLRTLGKIPGLQEIVDRLERHDAADVPSLQGGLRGLRRTHRVWTPSVQAGAIAGGALLAGYGLFLQRGLGGRLVGAAGTALVLRGIFNRPLPELIGRRGGVVVEKTIVVDAPIHRVFELWRRPENFPRFMEHVRGVELHGARSRWAVDGPAGSVVKFESEITKLEPDRLICWRTLPDQPIEHAGIVRFDEVDGRTRVIVRLEYHPPGGRLVHTLAHVLGWDPKARMDDDLARMKALIEEGFTRAHRRRIAIEDLH